jgi:putative MATE family efflux protein
VQPTRPSSDRERDHTKGRLLGSVFVLALPSILTGIFGHGLFQIVELRFLGELGPTAVAAAGSANQILRQFFFLPTFGMSIAVQMWIALRVGAGHVEQAERAAGQAFVIGGVLALAACVAGLFAGTLVAIVAQDAGVIALGTAYVRITFFTLSAVIATQLFTSVLMGAGDSTTPLLIALGSTPLSIAAQWVLTFGGFGIAPMGIAGIALGAAFGGLFGTAVSLWVIFTGRCRVHIRGRHLVPDRAVLAEILSFGWQPTAHFFARSLIIMVFMWLAGRLGGSVQAAFTIGLRIEILVAMVAFPIASACATLVGQNLGAGDAPRAWRAIGVSMAAVTGVTAPAALILFFHRQAIAAWFTDDAVVAAMAAEYLFFVSFLLVFYGLYFVALRTLQAAGDMNTPMLISVTLAVGVGTPLGVTLSSFTDLGATGMWIANLIYGVLNSMAMVLWLLTGRWVHRKRPMAQ